MKTLAILFMLLLTVSASVSWSRAEQATGETAAGGGGEAGGRFLSVPVYLDAGDEPLAAYQFQLSASQGRMRVVGVENGEHAAFAEAPYFDREAVSQGRADRIIVAAFSTLPGDQLPAGRTRVATVHAYVEGDTEPQWQLELIRAGNTAGQPIPAAIDTVAQNRQE
ncbi:MAG: hypothetical protein WD534_16485 [Phycisphaeraceae bacterium]